MKKICTTLSVLLLAAASWASVDVTFRVDMTNQSVGGGGVHLAGDLQSEAGFPTDWDPSTTAMTDGDANNIYEVTLTLPENTTFNYKFVNGNAWGSDENSIPGACNSGGNRFFTTGTTDELRPVFCFNECSFCASNPQFRDVTFQVDMQNVTVSGNGVHLAGGFAVSGYTDWNPGNAPGAIVMTDDDFDEVYDVTLSLNEGYYYEFKFINGNDWGFDESVPGACASNNNRSFVCPTAPSTVIPEVCFASCSDCIPNPSFYDVTFRVNMNQETVSPNGVHLAGSFASAGYVDWNPGNSPGALQMTDGDLDGVYEYTLTLQEGVYYEYKYINGNDWSSPMPEDFCGSCVSGCGGNRSHTVGSSDESLQIVCFESCINCVAPTSVTFQVNMNNVSVSPNGVHLAGSFGGDGYAEWQAGSIAMTDPDIDGIYSVTLDLTDLGSYEYKFVNGNDFGSAEVVPALCGTDDGFGGNNRTLQVSGSMTLGAVCLGSCDNCSGVSNDLRSAATSIAPYDFPFCVTKNGDVSDANPSYEAASAAVTGEDVWYRFVANSVGVQIQATTSSFNAMIELQDADGNTIASENAVVGSGSEILNYYDSNNPLINGQIYYIAVRNYDSSQSAGAFTLCVRKIRATGCGNGTGPFTMCQNLKAVYTGAQSYTFTFINTTTLAETVVTANGGVTIVPLSSLLPGFSYTVSIAATYSLLNGNNETEIFTVVSSNTCTIAMAAHPGIFLRVQDDCVSGPRPANAIIGANTWLCGATHYEWQFQQIAPFLQITFGAAYPGAANNRFISLPPGVLTPGATYNVQVRPVFPGGVLGSWGPYGCLTIVGPAEMVVSPQEEGTPVLRSLTDQEEKAGFALYPNPSNGERIQVTFTNVESDHAVVRVLDPTGRLVHSALFSVKNGDTRSLDFSESLSDGIYLIQVISGDTEQTRRLVVQTR